MANKRFVVGLGEALWDVLPEGKKLGGAPANFAYHTGQFGLDTLAISALGEDRLGDETIAAIEEQGLNYMMPRVPYPTGTVQVQLDDQGIPTYDIKENVAWDNIPFDDDIAAIARNCRAVCFGSLAQRNVVSRETIQKFLDATPEDCLKIFDINLRQQFYTQEVIRESLQRCNILKINVAQGQQVKEGDVLIVLEAMKMENEIVAPKGGTVAQIVVSKAQVVETGTPLVVIA